jgi:ribonuclease HII
LKAQGKFPWAFFCLRRGAKWRRLSVSPQGQTICHSLLNSGVLKSAAMMKRCSSRFEREARKCGWQRIAGLDEVGRGSLFGQVVAAAVILDPKRRIVGLDDSKKLPAERREVLAMRIREHALAWAIAEVDARRIDAWNIYQASRQAMAEALRQLKISPDYLLLDAMQLDVLIEQKSLIHGDALSISIAAASIIAKVERDGRMREWDHIYPQYGLAQHKGYATPEHLAALRAHGPTPHHRFSFAPVREATCCAAGATQVALPLPSLENS